MSGGKAGLLGAWGEEQAVSYLKKQGYRIRTLNFRCRGGELDIVASRGRYLAFVEVKLRRDASFAEAREFVTPAKQRRVIIAAQIYLAGHPTKLQPRFDVIEIYAPDGVETHKPQINHIKDAFEL